MSRQKIARLLFSVLLVLAMLIFAPSYSYAQESTDGFVGVDDIDDNTFNQVNPLVITGTDTNLVNQLSTPGGIISRVLEFASPIAGLILFVMIVWGGFEILTGAADKKSLDAGKQRITAAIIGFFLLFVSYWIIRVIEEALGIQVIF